MRYIFACLLFVSSIFGSDYTLSVCAIFQNEAPYMKEWIEYHKIQGVEHFWLYNNNSSDEYLEVLDPYIKSGSVELIDWPHTPETNDWKQFSFTIQPGAYRDGLERARNVSKWLALIDIDEFLVPLKDKSIVCCLEERFKDEKGLYIRWLTFGTSHIEKVLPGELMIEKLLLCALPLHDIYRKSIVNPNDVKDCVNPHYCLYTHGNHISDDTVDEFMRINHYWCRDEWFLQNIKMPRYEMWGIDANILRMCISELNQDTNLDIQKFVPILKKHTQ